MVLEDSYLDGFADCLVLLCLRRPCYLVSLFLISLALNEILSFIETYLLEELIFSWKPFPTLRDPFQFR